MSIISKVHAERNLDFFESYDIRKMKILQKEGDLFYFEKIMLRTKGCAKIEKCEASPLKVTLNPNISGCDLRFHLENPVLASGLAASVKIKNVKNLYWISIGFTDDSKSLYTYIKARNVILDEWFCIEFDYNDIIFYINNQKSEKISTSISDIRLYLHMEPQSEEATIYVHQLFAWRQKTVLPEWIVNINQEHFDEQVLTTEINYWKVRFANIDRFEIKNDCYLCNGSYLPKWHSWEKFPENMMNNVEYRFTWHAWDYVSACILKYLASNDLKYLLAAVEFASNWFNNSYFEPDSDFQYTWYDHSVPLRLEAMVMLYVFLMKNKLHTRFLEVLKSAIYRHAMLLSNEAFYGFNQLFRWHNHALFQDIALFFTSIILDEWPCAKYWKDISVSRIMGFYENLLTKENEVYISVENSIGYHCGLLSLFHRVHKMLKNADVENTLTSFSIGMQLFIDSVQYPNGLHPTFGDTYRENHFAARWEATESSKNSVNIFEKAGYAIIRGTVDNAFYQLTFICSSNTITHKHEDNCSFSLFLDGIEWLIDPSYYTYNPEEPISRYLRSSYAHNTVTLQGLQYNTKKHSAKISGISDDLHAELHMRHINYCEYEVARDFSGSLSDFNYTINDSIFCSTCQNDSDKEPVTARIMFHCGHGVVATQKSGKVILTHKDSLFRIIIEGISQDAIIHFNNVDDDFSNIRGICGLGFAEVSPINTIEYIIDNFSAISYTIRAEHE